MLTFFIILQFILLLFMLFHDWIAIPPFNDVPTLKAVDGNKGRLIAVFINATTVLIPLVLTINYYNQPMPSSVAFTIFLFYICLSVGTILSWWVPYYAGSTAQHKQRFSKFKNTHHFLPARGDNVIPNTLHVVLHVQVWVCALLALYFWLISR